MRGRLGDSFRQETSLNGVVDKSMSLSLPLGVRSVTVQSPDGTTTGVTPGKDGRFEWTPPIPGLYQVKTDQRENDFSFAANIPHLDHEGDLTVVNPNELKNIFPKASVEWVDDGPQGVERMYAVLQGK